MNYFSATPNKPFHLSVGAVVLTKDNKVLCHYLKKINELSEIYLLMRESIELSETMEETLNRGLMEEFGAKAEIITYIGSIVINEKWFGEIKKEVTVEKTTLYFLVKLISQDNALREKDDRESSSEIVDMDIDKLIEKMKDQIKRYKIPSLDESKILIDTKKYILSNSL